MLPRSPPHLRYVLPLTYDQSLMLSLLNHSNLDNADLLSNIKAASCISPWACCQVDDHNLTICKGVAGKVP